LTPLKSITTCLRKSFDFSGRATRAEFWWFAPCVIALTGIAVTSDAVFARLPRQFGVLGSILVVLFFVSFPVFVALVRRYRDAGLWPFAPLLLPAYLVIAPMAAIAVDKSALDLPGRTKGMPELIYAGFGYLCLSAGVLTLALLPSRTAPYSTREDEMTP
jgi:uncharacterized membrane protein YhaH (DUF805 family)